MNQMTSTDFSLPKEFTSPTYGLVSWDEALTRMVNFMGVDTAASYEVIIGTDSEAQNGSADYVSALIVHRKGRGGINPSSPQK